MIRLLVVLMALTASGFGGPASTDTYPDVAGAISAEIERDELPAPDGGVAVAEGHREGPSPACDMPGCLSMSGCTSTAVAAANAASLDLGLLVLGDEALFAPRRKPTPLTSRPPPPKV